MGLVGWEVHNSQAQFGSDIMSKGVHKGPLLHNKAKEMTS